MKEIIASSNEKIKWVRKLGQAKYRRESGCFVVEGFHMLEEALNRGAVVRQAFWEGQPEEALSERLEEMGAEVYSLKPQLFQSVSETLSPQGVLAVIEGLTEEWMGQDDLKGSLAVALDGVQDPGNLGSILRTAHGVGVEDVLLGEGCADPLSGKAARASMGAIFSLRVRHCAPLRGAIETMGTGDWHTACAHLKGTDFFSREPHRKTLLVVGSEGQGVSVEVADACTALYRLPMREGTESLNASVAAGIMLYDLWRNL